MLYFVMLSPYYGKRQLYPFTVVFFVFIGLLVSYFPKDFSRIALNSDPFFQPG